MNPTVKLIIILAAIILILAIILLMVKEFKKPSGNAVPTGGYMPPSQNGTYLPTSGGGFGGGLVGTVANFYWNLSPIGMMSNLFHKIFG